MTTDPSWALQVAVFSRLSVDAELATFVSDRIYQDVAAYIDWPGPYVVISEAQCLPDEADCIEGSEVFLTLDAYSQDGGWEEVKTIAEIIKQLLKDESLLSLSDHVLKIISRDNCVFRMESDNVTRRAIMTFRANTEPL